MRMKDPTEHKDACGWCGKNHIIVDNSCSTHAPDCARPSFHHNVGNPVVDLRLDEYLAVNLRWLLEQTHGTHDTGDWHGVLTNMLDEIDFDMEPNGD